MSLSKKIKVAAVNLIFDDLTPRLLGGKIAFLFMKHNNYNIVQQTMILKDLRLDHFRIPFFCEQWIDKYLETDFFRLFRLTRTTVEILIGQIGPHCHIRNVHSGGRVQVPIEKRVLVLLQYLGTGDNIFHIANNFNITESCVHSTIGEMLYVIIKLKEKYISWPNEEKRKHIMEAFKKVNGFPGVIGAIDGTHVKCKIPAAQQDSYCDRKFDHSITIQGICDNKRLFTNVSVGWPGSIHDARIFKESLFGRTLEKFGPSHYFTEDHILGDSAYALKTYLLTPYRDIGRLSNVQKKYNTRLSQIRVVIEHCFGLLKGRWRILQYVNVYSIKRAVLIITACCVLHNFCILAGDYCEEEEILFKRTRPLRTDIDVESMAAILKRDIIALSL